MDQVWDQFRDNIPHIVGALAILIIGYIVALIISRLVGAAVRRSGLDGRIARLASGPDRTSPVDGARIARKVVFWLIMLFVLVAFLQNTGLTIITEPVNAFLTTVLAFLPRLIGALVIAAIAWLVATIVRTLAQRVLGLTRLDERLGTATADGRGPLTTSLAQIAYFLVWLFFLPAILGALALNGLLGPVQNMIDQILAFLPNLAAAALILVIAFFVARLLAQIVAGLLAGVGFDNLPERLGAGRVPTGGQSPSRIAGQLVLVLIMLFASIEALNTLGFVALAGIVTGLLALLGRVALGLMIFGLGFYLARLAARAVRSSGLANAPMLALVAQGAVLALAGAMALQQMGFATQIINLAFGLTLGAIAVAAALAFGLGGREVARDQLREWTQNSETGEGEQPTVG